MEDARCLKVNSRHRILAFYFSDRDLIMAFVAYFCALIAFCKEWGCAEWFSVSVAHFLIVLAECVNGNSPLDWRPEFCTGQVRGLKANRLFLKLRSVNFAPNCTSLPYNVNTV